MNETTAVIHVVDDDLSFLKAISRMLRASGLEVKTYDSASGFLSQGVPDTHGCVIADLRMPAVSGLELQEALVKDGNPIPVIFLSGDGDIPSTVRAMRQGAEDFLCKRSPKTELLAAIKRAVDRDVRERTERARLREIRDRFRTLTPRDCEVLAHVLRGRLNKQIARDLGVDERSIKRHRTSIMGKLQVGSVAELADLVHTAGLMDTFRLPFEQCGEPAAIA